MLFATRTESSCRRHATGGQHAGLLEAKIAHAACIEGKARRVLAERDTASLVQHLAVGAC